MKDDYRMPTFDRRRPIGDTLPPPADDVPPVTLARNPARDLAAIALLLRDGYVDQARILAERWV